MKVLRNKVLPLVGLAVCVSAAWAVDKDSAKFTPPEIDSVETKQTVSGVTIAVRPFHTETLAKTAFGKLNPYEHGILPVLLMVRNDSKKTIRLSEMRPEYVSTSRARVAPTPAAEVKYAKAPRRPNMNPGPIPGIRFGRKNPLAAGEIEARAFSAQMLPPGETAYGFLYFQTGHRNGSILYVTGVQDAATNQDLFYFEVPLD
jgi:hypothetical protein